MHDERAAAEQNLIDRWLYDPNTLLLEAASRGYPHALVYALDTAGADVCYESETTRGVVYEAAGAVNDGGIKCIQALLDRGATLSTDPANNTLHAACANGCHKTVAWLLQQPEANALMTTVSMYSRLTAFGIAVRWAIGPKYDNGYGRCVCLLLQHGYKPTEADFVDDHYGSARAIVANRHAYERFIAVMVIVKFRKHEARLSADVLRDVARLVWRGPWSMTSSSLRKHE